MTISATVLDQTRSNKHSNAIALCVDENYLPYALFVALQIIELESYPIDICICTPNLNNVPEHFKKLPIRFLAVDIEGIDNLRTDHLSKAIYYRLFLPELLKSDYNYIIYLDADVYIRKPFLNELFNIIQNYPDDFSVAASPYMGEVEMLTFPESQNKKIKRYLNRYHSKNHLYRNSGVLILNVKNFLNQDIQSKIFNTIRGNPDKLESHDQSAINLTLLSDISLLPIQFNWQLNPLSFSIINEVDPFIIHFVNVNKPWVTKNYYLKEFINEYESFINKNFTHLRFNPLTEIEKRTINPKYSGIKEAISYRWFKRKVGKKEAQLYKEYNSSKDKILTAISDVNKGIYSTEDAS